MSLRRVVQELQIGGTSALARNRLAVSKQLPNTRIRHKKNPGSRRDSKG